MKAQVASVSVVMVWAATSLLACAARSEEPSVPRVTSNLAAAEDRSWVVGAQLRDTDAKSLVERLNSSNLKKDEFETGADFEARTSRALSSIEATLANNPNGRSVVIASTTIDRLFTSYDADRQLLTVKGLAVTGLAGLLDALMIGPKFEYAWAIESLQVLGRKESYTGQTAFGAKSRVRKTRVTSYLVAFGLGSNHFQPWPYRGWSGQIPLEPERAKVVRDQLSLTVIGYLAPPYVFQTSDYVAPTISAPVELFIDKRGAVIRGVCGAVRNSTTGEVYLTFPLRS